MTQRHQSRLQKPTDNLQKKQQMRQNIRQRHSVTGQRLTDGYRERDTEDTEDTEMDIDAVIRQIYMLRNRAQIIQH